jgi:hypothetical protein
MAWSLYYVTVVYTWTTQGENCSYCDALDGQQFFEGEEPGSHPNCDCILVPTSIWDWELLAEAEPGIARLLTYTDMSGKKVLTSDGLGPSMAKVTVTIPKPNYYSDYQLANL